MSLEDLLFDISDLSDEEAFDEGRRIYEDEYAGADIHLYNGDKVIFHKDRYDHAFMTSRDRARNPYSKKIIALDRIEKIRWIKEVLAGNVEGSQCWCVWPKEGNRRERDRLMIVWDHRYVIWLNPRKDGGWRFSSAYQASAQDIRRYTQGGTKTWEKKIAP
jgi:hypothetical protein